VKGIGKIAFQNSAGFLRVMDGIEPLDSTIVHPEKYSLVKSLLNLLCSPSPSPVAPPPPPPLVPSSDSNEIDLPVRKKAKKVASRSSRRNELPLMTNIELQNVLFSSELRQKSVECNWTDLSLRLGEEIDSLKLLTTWVSDPFYSSTSGVDLRGVKGVAPLLTKKCLLSPQDYQPGHRVRGVVRNITSFGAFVDIGAKEDALMHRSKYGLRRGPKGFVIGEAIFCRVLPIDAERAKISLEFLEEVEQGQGQRQRLTPAAADASADQQSVLTSVVSRTEQKGTEILSSDQTGGTVSAKKRRRPSSVSST
jgi:predicted RNA-binding protein with RPS1 domain